MRFVFGIFAFAVLALAGCQKAPTAQRDAPVITTMPGVSEMSPEQARPGVEAAYSQFVDVRTPQEYAAEHAYRARNIPIDELMSNLDKLEKNEPVYLICQTGNRSRKAAQMLVDAGFPQAISVAGGTEAWKAAGLPMGQ
jgi:rhodanese-related sulfurtransferase